jgi:hypothetical protein
MRTSRTYLATMSLAVSLMCALPVVGGPLHDAAKKGDVEAVKKLISQGASVNEKDYKGDTPLDWAASEGHTAIIELLVTNGADVNERDQHAANVAASFYRMNGMEVKESEIMGPTLLHIAVDKNDIELTTFLIEHGADMNAKAMGGFSIGGDIYFYKNLTPLKLAKYWEEVKRGERKTIIKLLRRQQKRH